MPEYDASTAIFIFSSVAIYLLPTIIAFSRRRPDRWFILCLNVFLGITIIGWVISLHHALEAKHIATHSAGYSRGHEEESGLKPWSGLRPFKPAKNPKERIEKESKLDPVEFGVSYPSTVALREPFIVDAWIFEKHDRDEVARCATQIRSSPVRFMSGGSAGVARGSTIRIKLHIDGWDIKPKVQTILWSGAVENISFTARPGRSESGFPKRPGGASLTH